MFINKSKPIEITFFTSNPKVFETAKPDKAVKFMPDWFKNFESQKIGRIPHPTLKGCRGLIDLYSNGIMLQSWCEIFFNIGKIGSETHSWQFADYESEASVHPKNHFPKQIELNNFAHVKLHFPWKLVCDEPLQWSWQGPIWNDFDNFIYKVIPAVTEYKYQHGLNVNLIFQRQLQDYEYLMKHNIPLAHLIPISDRKRIKIKYECVSAENFQKFENPRISFVNGYLNYIKIVKGNK